MKYRVIFLPEAERDLAELADYIKSHFSQKIWLNTKSKIKKAVTQLSSHPESGSVFEELEFLGIDQY